MDQNKGKKIQMPAALPQSRKRNREDYLNHPKFMEMFGAAMVEVQTPKDAIPEWMRSKLTFCLLQMSFPALSCPVHIYEELATIPCEEMTFGVLQKAADIIFSSKPDVNESLERHCELIKAMAHLLDAMKMITDPVRDKVIDDLIVKDSIIK